MVNFNNHHFNEYLLPFCHCWFELITRVYNIKHLEMLFIFCKSKPWFLCIPNLVALGCEGELQLKMIDLMPSVVLSPFILIMFDKCIIDFLDLFKCMKWKWNYFSHKQGIDLIHWRIFVVECVKNRCQESAPTNAFCWVILSLL